MRTSFDTRTTSRRKVIDSNESAAWTWRQLLWFEVRRYPTAEWLARQITEAFPWASAPAYLVRDNDRASRLVFMSRGSAMPGERGGQSVIGLDWCLIGHGSPHVART